MVFDGQSSRNDDDRLAATPLHGHGGSHRSETTYRSSLRSPQKGPVIMGFGVQQDAAGQCFRGGPHVLKKFELKDEVDQTIYIRCLDRQGPLSLFLIREWFW